MANVQQQKTVKKKKGKSRKKHYDYFADGIQKLDRMYQRGKGRSKYELRQYRAVKNRRKQSKLFIHSLGTLQTYKKHWRAFCRYLQREKIRIERWSDVEGHIDAYLAQLRAEGKRETTVAVAECALNKLCANRYREPSTHPPRRRADIVKSRQHSFGYYLEMLLKYPELVRFCLATGLRKQKELANVRGSDLVRRGGTLCLRVIGKNGQLRYAEILGDEETLTHIEQLCLEAGESRLFRKLPSELDVHALRAVYACRIYLRHAHPTAQLDRAEQYRCRADYQGVVLDRNALRPASEALGHHRDSVIPGNYIWPLLTMDDDTKRLFGLIPGDRIIVPETIKNNSFTAQRGDTEERS